MNSPFGANPTKPGLKPTGGVLYNFLKRKPGNLDNTNHHPTSRPYVAAESSLLNWRLAKASGESQKIESQLRINNQTNSGTSIVRPDNRAAGNAFTADYHSNYFKGTQYKKYLFYALGAYFVYYVLVK